MRKAGKKINHHAAIIPLGVKRTTYEISARASMLAIQRGVCNEQNIIDMYVLALLCEHLNEGKERHISTHAASVKKLAEAIHNKTCDVPAAVSIVASGNILLDWVHKQDNKRVFDIAMQQSKRLAAKK